MHKYSLWIAARLLLKKGHKAHLCDTGTSFINEFLAYTKYKHSTHDKNGATLGEWKALFEAKPVNYHVF